MRARLATFGIIALAGCGVPLLPPLPDAPAPEGLPASYAVYSVVLDALAADTEAQLAKVFLVGDSTVGCDGSPCAPAQALTAQFRTRVSVRLVPVYEAVETGYLLGRVAFNLDSTRAHLLVYHGFNGCAIGASQFELARHPAKAWAAVRRSDGAPQCRQL